MSEFTNKVYAILSERAVAKTPEEVAEVAMTREEIMEAVFPDIEDNDKS